MAKKDALARKKLEQNKPHQPKREDEEARHMAEFDHDKPNPTMFGDQIGMNMLHSQVGNLAVQQMLSSDNSTGMAEANPGMAAQIQRRMEEEEEGMAQMPAKEEEQGQEQVEEQTEGELPQYLEQKLEEDSEYLPNPLSKEEAAKSEESEEEQAMELYQEAAMVEEEAEPLEAGEILIDKPDIKTYTVGGKTVDEAISQIKPPDQWFETEYNVKTETDDNNRITKADIKINFTIYVPEWVGHGRDNASPQDEAKWQQSLSSLQIFEDKMDEDGELARPLLLGELWEKAPDDLKKPWLELLEVMHEEEEGHPSTLYRRGTLLQQRLLNQLGDQEDQVISEFVKNVEDEEAEYTKKREIGSLEQIQLTKAKLAQ